MIKEITYFYKYKVLEIKRCGEYCYYLEKIGYGNLFYLYSTLEECMPTIDMVLNFIHNANEQDFWGD